jgi:hypothetical protein
MAEYVKLGSAEWFTQSADKLLGLGMDVLRYETMKGSSGGGETTPAQSTATSMLESKLPFILGGVALIGIGIILWKR